MHTYTCIHVHAYTFFVWGPRAGIIFLHEQEITPSAFVQKYRLGVSLCMPARPWQTSRKSPGTAPTLTPT